MSDITLISIDDKYADEIQRNETFLIDTSIKYGEVLDKSVLIESNSIFSWKFEIKDNMPQHIIDKLYTCECGEASSQQKEGLQCMSCFTTVKKNTFPSDKMAYIKMPDKYKVLTPIGLAYLKKAIGKNNYEKFLKGKMKGFDDIYDAFEEILDTYAKNNKRDITDFMKSNKVFLFTGYIPVISSKVRFFNVSENMDIKKIDIHDLNAPYIQISTSVEIMKKALSEDSPLRVRSMLFIIQELIDILSDILKNTFSGGKKKMLRDGIFGTRVPYTSIAVLTPLTEYWELNSCSIPIETFKVTFKREIKGILLNQYKMPIMKVVEILSAEHKLTDKEKKLMKDIFKKIKEPYIYINRQPTIDVESIMMMEIKEIRDEKTLRVHPNLLDGLRGDHDGDALIIVGIPEQVRKHFFDRLSPRAYIIDPFYKFNDIYKLKNDFQTLFTMAMEEEPDGEMVG